MKTLADANSYQSENSLERDLVAQLSRQGWERVSIHNADDMEANFRTQLNKHNSRTLKGVPLSDAEFRNVMVHIKNRGVFDSAKLLRDKQTLTRDDGTTINYSLLNTREWCKNIFQVTNQVSTKGKTWSTRYDVTLLINGLPLIQMELKRRGEGLDKAFNQVCRYQQDKAYEGLFKFIQFFVISNGVNTKYFANSDSLYNKAFSFHWTNDCNERYSNLSDFATDFLDKCWAAKMVSRYMVVQESTRNLIVLRPYQVYGVEKMVARALDSGNNGFIWHTTGSGKTLTSFTAARILKESTKFKKVIFLVDRMDLNTQTRDEFNQFQSGSVSDSKNTWALVQNIASNHFENKLILTTIQKLDQALKNQLHASVMDAMKDEPVLFVIDECHRTQFGDMHKAIRKHFNKAQYFGFTGTPRFSENKSQDGRTTADVFGECLHTYLLKDSIHDGNTLELSIEYAVTVHAKDEVENGDLAVEGIRTNEVWKQPERIAMISRDIIEDRGRKSRSGKFNAMLTTDSVRSSIAYMEALKTASESLPEDKRLTIAAVYSYDANEAMEIDQEHARAALERLIGDYNETFGTNHSTSEASRYNEDVAKRFKRNEIDLLVVVDMMLTGFDSPTLNTLYVDRNFEHHTLIQAYSRTNRVHGADKSVGHIKCYRDLKDATDAAIRLFSNVDNANEVLAIPYPEQVKAYEAALTKLQAVVSTPAEVSRLESEADKQEFVLAFRAFMREHRRIETFVDFDHGNFDISRQEIEDFRSHYLDISVDTAAPGNEASILNDIDFRLEEILLDVINVDYIFRLMGEIDHTDPRERKNLRDTVVKDGSPKLRAKRELLLDFIDDIMPTIPAGESVQDWYLDYLDAKVREEIEKEAKTFGLTVGILLEILSSFRYSGKLDLSLFTANTTLDARGIFRSRKKLKELIISLTETLEMEE